jgi:hypothetical protein
MDDLLLFTILPGDKNLLPGRILQLHCTGFGAVKIAGCNLLSVDTVAGAAVRCPVPLR